MANIHNSRKPCPHCGKLLIAPMGNPKSPYLLVGDFPGYAETVQGLPFAFGQPNSYKKETRAGDILKDELTRVGIMLNQVLITNMWQHQKDWKIEIIPAKTARGKDKEHKVEACPSNWHLDELVRLFEGRTHVLLMGSEVTQALIGENVQAVSGTRVKVNGFPKIHFWVSPNPSLAFSQPIGELRLALERFSEDVKKSSKTK